MNGFLSINILYGVMWHHYVHVILRKENENGFLCNCQEAEKKAKDFPASRYRDVNEAKS